MHHSHHNSVSQSGRNDKSLQKETVPDAIQPASDEAELDNGSIITPTSSSQSSSQTKEVVGNAISAVDSPSIMESPPKDKPSRRRAIESPQNKVINAEPLKEEPFNDNTSMLATDPILEADASDINTSSQTKEVVGNAVNAVDSPSIMESPPKDKPSRRRAIESPQNKVINAEPLKEEPFNDNTSILATDPILEADASDINTSSQTKEVVGNAISAVDSPSIMESPPKDKPSRRRAIESPQNKVINAEPLKEEPFNDNTSMLATDPILEADASDINTSSQTKEVVGNAVNAVDSPSIMESPPKDKPSRRRAIESPQNKVINAEPLKEEPFNDNTSILATDPILEADASDINTSSQTKEVVGNSINAVDSPSIMESPPKDKPSRRRAIESPHNEVINAEPLKEEPFNDYTSMLATDPILEAEDINTAEFKCGSCEKGYKNRCHLKRHEAGHTGRTPFECSYCERTFVRNDHKLNHRKTHLRKLASTINADISKDLDTFKDLLQSTVTYGEMSHIRTATEKDYVYHQEFICGLCGKRCSSENELGEHGQNEH